MRRTSSVAWHASTGVHEGAFFVKQLAGYWVTSIGLRALRSFGYLVGFFGQMLGSDHRRAYHARAVLV